MRLVSVGISKIFVLILRLLALKEIGDKGFGGPRGKVGSTTSLVAGEGERFDAGEFIPLGPKFELVTLGEESEPVENASSVWTRTGIADIVVEGIDVAGVKGEADMKIL